MNTARGFKIGMAVLALGSLMLSGCVVRPAPRYYGEDTVMVAPPPAPVEVVGAAPAPGYVWIGGYWNWVGGRHVWVAGRWGMPPHPGYHWVPHRWVAYGGGWRLQRGHWAR
ncbi:MAG TPA: YXWGXW repeat-containing protein [Steroidobacteraceae bacterium]